MKIKSIVVASITGVAVLLSSCVVDPGVYGASVSYTATTGYGATYSTSVAWTNASYDSNGFPIYGYSYGRPVYGYTEAGVAIFTIAALTALCFVPDWGPAPWYHGPHYYPTHIHRVPAPPRYAHGHHPHHRPAGGMNAPIHRNPSSVLGKPNNPKPNHKPAINHNRPNNTPVGNHGRPNNVSKPAINHNRPNNKPIANPGRPNNVSKPAANHNRPNNRPVANHGRPNNVGKPTINNNRPNNRPIANPGRSNNVNRPAINNTNRPSNVSKPALNHNRLNSVSRPTVNHSRPSNISKPTQSVSRPAAGAAAPRVSSNMSRPSGAPSHARGAGRGGRR